MNIYSKKLNYFLCLIYCAYLNYQKPEKMQKSIVTSFGASDQQLATDCFERMP